MESAFLLASSAEDEENILVVVDHVPEAVKDFLSSHNSNHNRNHNNNSNNNSGTPETLSLLTDTDESMENPATAIINGKTTTNDATPHKGTIHRWCRTKHYSDLVLDGLKWLLASSSSSSSSSSSINMNAVPNPEQVVMVFESPSTANPHSGSSFYNDKLFQFYDYPLSNNEVKSILVRLHDRSGQFPYN
jgi:hypothetical protein